MIGRIRSPFVGSSWLAGGCGHGTQAFRHPCCRRGGVQPPPHGVDLATTRTPRLIRAKRRSRLGVRAGALIALATVSGAIGWHWTREPPDPVLALPRGSSIAVLPLTNMSGDPNDTYFSNGLTEDIITRLPGFPICSLSHATRPPSSRTSRLTPGTSDASSGPATY